METKSALGRCSSVCVLSLVLAAVAVCEDEQVNALRSAASRFALRLEPFVALSRSCVCALLFINGSSFRSPFVVHFFWKIGISVVGLNGGKFK